MPPGLTLSSEAAAALLGAQRVALVLLAESPDAALWLYGVRLTAFLVIIGAILDKNRSGRR